MKYIFTLLLLSASLLALSENQIEVRNKVFEIGKQFNLEYTLTAIAKVESQYGKYFLNIQDKDTYSCGTFHILTSSLINRTNLEDTKWNQTRLCERLILDLDFSISAAMLELKWWQNYWTSKSVDRVWSHMIASYNGGFNINIRTNKYLQKIKHEIRQLKKDKL